MVGHTVEAADIESGRGAHPTPSEDRGFVYRFQDREGRGPFRPGMSARWRSDLDCGENLPPYFMEMGITPSQASHLFTRGWYGGIGCESRAQLNRWFSRSEQRRLTLLGYRLVEFKPDRIIARTPTQVVFEHRTPLWTIPASGADGQGPIAAQTADDASGMNTKTSPPDQGER
jgi:hypothetical protein